MLPLLKQWQIAPRIPPQVDETLSGYHPVLRQILYNRGCGDPDIADRFLNASPPPETDPFKLKNIDQAVDRIRWAIHKEEPIIIYGDYDVDGVTATTLLIECLRGLGAKVEGYIPNRFEEGYGLNIDALANLKQDGVKLVITVDCGIRSFPEAEYASQVDLDMIISDHHQPLAELPPALAIINPKQPGDIYPDNDLAGVGIAYKLASALWVKAVKEKKQNMNSPRQIESILESYHDLVALGTVADLAPLVGENRHLVRSGLRKMSQSQRVGLRELVKVSGKDPTKITSTDIGFVLGPRLNAAGRLESALAALELLLTSDVHRANVLAQQLDNQNRERQEVTRQLLKLAEESVVKDGFVPLLLFASGAEFNPGVIGLVASKLVDHYYRPAIVAHQGEEFTRASCRSISEFHITEALDQCADLMEHHGGHAAAAGFTIRNENVPLLIERLQDIAQEKLSALELQPSLHADMEVSLTELNGLLSELARLQPTGYGNPTPTFVSRGLQVKRFQPVGREKTHLKLTVTQGQVTFDGIAFQQGHWVEHMPKYVDLLYRLEENEFAGINSLQLNIIDIKPSSINP